MQRSLAAKQRHVVKWYRRSKLCTPWWPRSRAGNSTTQRRSRDQYSVPHLCLPRNTKVCSTNILGVSNPIHLIIKPKRHNHNTIWCMEVRLGKGKPGSWRNKGEEGREAYIQGNNHNSLNNICQYIFLKTHFLNDILWIEYYWFKFLVNTMV